MLIWPDNDLPGERYAEEVARLVAEAGARKIEVHKPPSGLPVGWDLADPVPEGWTPPTEQPSPAMPARGLPLISWADFKNKPQEDVDWLVDGLLRRPGMSMLAGDPKAGKSMLARTLTRAVALGEPWLDREVQQGKVVYCALEESEVDIQEHFLKMGLPDGAPVDIIFERDPEAMLRKFQETIEDSQPALVVVDTSLGTALIRPFEAFERMENQRLSLTNEFKLGQYRWIMRAACSRRDVGGIRLCE